MLLSVSSWHGDQTFWREWGKEELLAGGEGLGANGMDRNSSSIDQPHRMVSRN